MERRIILIMIYSLKGGKEKSEGGEREGNKRGRKGAGVLLRGGTS